MKKQLLFVSILFAGSTFAQTLTQANEPQIGDAASMFLCDSNVTNMENVTGAGVTWDYSGILAIPGEMRTIEIIDPATSQYASDFPGATKAVSLEGFLTNFWISSASDRRSNGFVFEEPSFGVVKATFDDDDQILATYPFALNGTANDVYEGTLAFEFSGIPQSPDALGVSLGKIDGSGTLKLNAATTITDVVRYVLIDTLRASINIGLPLDIELVRAQYEYYGPDGGLPLFIHSSALIQNQGAATPLTAFTVVLSSVEPDGSLSTSKIPTVEFAIYPNPVNDVLMLKGNFTQATSVQILDQTGKLVQTIENYIPGTAISTSDLNAGIYLVQVATNEGISTQKFVKK